MIIIRLDVVGYTRCRSINLQTVSKVNMHTHVAVRELEKQDYSRGTRGSARSPECLQALRD